MGNCKVGKVVGVGDPGSLKENSQEIELCVTLQYTIGFVGYISLFPCTHASANVTSDLAGECQKVCYEGEKSTSGWRIKCEWSFCKGCPECLIRRE